MKNTILPAANPGAVVSGGLTFRADAGAESVSLSGTLDFSVTLADGNVLRGNAFLPEVREDEGGESPYPEEPMTFTVDGVSSPVGTAAVENYDGYVMFTVTPQPDAGLFSDIYDAGYDYIQLLLLPGYLNEELDVLDSPAVIYGWRSSDGTSTGLPVITLFICISILPPVPRSGSMLSDR